MLRQRIFDDSGNITVLGARYDDEYDVWVSIKHKKD